MKNFYSQSFLFLATLVVFASLENISPGGGRDLRQLFLSQAPGGWEKMRLLMGNVEGSGSQSIRLLKKSETGLKPFREHFYSWRFKINKDLLLFERTRLDESKNKEKFLLGASNSQYIFFLDKRSSSWLLSHMDTEKDRFEAQHPYRMAWGKGFIRYLERPWTVAGLPLPQMVSEPGFNLKNISEVKRKGKDLVKVEFAYTLSPEHKPSFVKGKIVKITPHLTAARGGWFLCDPELCWAIVEYELPASENYKATAVLDYQEGKGGVPVPRRVLLQELDKEGQGEIGELVFENFEFREIPESEFTLTAFGLPEPQGVVWPSKTRWYLWFLGIGVVFLALGIYFRRRVLRREQGSAKVVSQT